MTNAELSVVGSGRIIIPTLFREKYLNYPRVLTREGNPVRFLDAMQKVDKRTAEFDFEDLDKVITKMKECNAFGKFLTQFKLLSPSTGAILNPAPYPLKIYISTS